MSPISFELLDALRERLPVGTDPKQAKILLDGVLKNTVGNPLLHQYVAHLDTPNARNTLPWHAMGERLYWMLVAAAEPRIPWVDGNGAEYEDPTPLAASYCAAMISSQVYLLRNNAAALARAMPDLPRHVISRKCMQYPAMFFSRETANSGDGLESNAMLLVDTGSGMAAFMDAVREKDTGPTMTCGTVDYGKTYPDDFSGLEREAVGITLKTLAFLASTVASVSPERMGRGERRRMEKAGLPRHEYEAMVSVIELRAAEQAQPSGDTSGEAEWRHHWWVRGHWRAQWFPSEQAHHPVWVSPYVKGDLDKPLLEKVYHVNR